MSEKHSDKKGMNFLVADVTDLGSEEFPDASYDVVIDKATLDAIMCGEGSTDHVVQALSEVQRVLKPGEEQRDSLFLFWLPRVMMSCVPLILECFVSRQVARSSR